MADGAPKKRDVLGFTTPSLDPLPLDVVGCILSKLASGRSIARASGTCRKWQAASKHRLSKLSFSDRDFDRTNSGICELAITNLLMQTTQLSELSIDCPRTPLKKLSASAVIAWLLHSKRTLKSLTLMNEISPPVNVLEKLGGGEGQLEFLVWKDAFIPRLSSAHRFPLLVSLTLAGVVQGITSGNLSLLLYLCPKLEFLSIMGVEILEVPSTNTIELKCCSLKTCNMEDVTSTSYISLTLCMNSLERMSISNMRFNSLECVQEEVNKSLQYLLLDTTSIACLKLRGEGLLTLVIRESPIEQFEVEELVSLHELVIVSDIPLSAYWSMTYSQVALKASGKLHSLTLRGGYICESDDEWDVDMIAARFPCLNKLSVDHDHCLFLHDPPLIDAFMEVTQLELHATIGFYSFDERIVAELLARCWNLQSFVLLLDPRYEEPYDNYEAIGQIATAILPVTRLYPRISVSFEFL